MLLSLGQVAFDPGDARLDGRRRIQAAGMVQIRPGGPVVAGDQTDTAQKGQRQRLHIPVLQLFRQRQAAYQMSPGGGRVVIMLHQRPGDGVAAQPALDGSPFHFLSDIGRGQSQRQAPAVLANPAQMVHQDGGELDQQVGVCPLVGGGQQPVDDGDYLCPGRLMIERVGMEGLEIVIAARANGIGVQALEQGIGVFQRGGSQSIAVQAGYGRGAAVEDFQPIPRLGDVETVDIGQGESDRLVARAAAVLDAGNARLVQAGPRGDIGLAQAQDSYSSVPQSLAEILEVDAPGALSDFKASVGHGVLNYARSA